MTREIYQSRKSAGLCPYCGGADARVKAGRTFCERCNSRRKESDQWKKQRLKDKGLCIACGQWNDRAVFGLLTCSVCSRYDAEKRRIRMKRKEAAQ